MSNFVSTYPPPPDFYKKFSDPSFAPEPPAVVELSNSEIYGGSMLLPESGKDTYNPQRDYRADLKRALKEYMLEGLNFVCDGNPRQPFDKGAIAIEMKSTELYSILNEYRSHEAREALCVEMRRQVSELEELKKELTSTLDEATALYNDDIITSQSLQQDK